MTITKLDARQTISRDTLDQLAAASGAELDNLLRSINKELTPPLRLSQTTPTADRVVNIGAISVTNTETNRNRIVPTIVDGIPNFTSGTVTFPATAGGAITVSAGTGANLVMSNSSFIKVGIGVDSSGDLSLSFGAEGASEALASAPPLISGSFTIGYAVVETDGSGNVQNITNADLYQFVGGGGGSSGGGGEGINYVLNPNASSNVNDYVATGTAAVSRTTTASELPREPLFQTAIKLSSGAGGDYVRYRFSIGDADKNKQLLLSWAQKPESGYGLGDWQIKIFKADSGYTTFDEILIPVTNNNIPAGEYVFQVPVTTSSNDNYEIRFIRQTGSKYLVINNLSFGPQEPVSVPNMTDYVSYSPTLTNITFSSLKAHYKLVGDQLHMYIDSTLNATPTGNIAISLPSGFTIKSSVVDVNVGGNEVLGVAEARLSASWYQGLVSPSTSTSIEIRTADDGGSNAVWNAGNPGSWASGDHLNLFAIIPVNESSSTIFARQTAVEYAASTNGTWDANATAPNTIYGPDGAPIDSTLTADRTKIVLFRNPILPTDVIKLQLKVSGGGWIDAGESRYGQYITQNTTNYGAGIDLLPINNAVTVAFGQYIHATGATYGSAGLDWGGTEVTAWRLVKASNPLALGHKIVTQTDSGLVESAGQLKGTNSVLDSSNDGNVGQKIDLYGSVNVPATNTFYDIDTFDFAGLAPGQFLFSINGVLDRQAATFTTVMDFILGLTTDSGNSFANIDETRTAFEIKITDLTADKIASSISDIEVNWDGTDLTIDGVAGSGSVLRLKGYAHNMSAGTSKITGTAKGFRYR